MKVKICGMKLDENIRDISALHPDYMGFIFYPHSARYVGREFTIDALHTLPDTVKKVAVFVNEPIENVMAIQEQYEFDYVQLHGDETPSYCQKLRNNNVHIIKAFAIDHQFDFTSIRNYVDTCQLFILDSKGKSYGGNGQSFDWNLLDKYHEPVSFLLSGGIGNENIDHVMKIKHARLIGIDINSRIESSPGVKSITSAQQIINSIRNHE